MLQKRPHSESLEFNENEGFGFTFNYSNAISSYFITKRQKNDRDMYAIPVPDVLLESKQQNFNLQALLSQLSIAKQAKCMVNNKAGWSQINHGDFLENSSDERQLETKVQNLEEKLSPKLREKLKSCVLY